jgi:hypothetical protein
MVDPGLLRRIVRVFGALPGFQALKGDALLAEQGAQALVADAAATPSATRNSASFDRLQVENGRSPAQSRRSAPAGKHLAEPSPAGQV